MDRYRGPTLMAAPIMAAPPEGKRLRRKLQKVGTQQRSAASAKKAEQDGSNNIALGNNKFASLNMTPAGAQPILQLPPDLSDSKWSAYVRKSGIVEPAVKRRSLQSKETVTPTATPTKTSPPVIPEFAHLTITDGSRDLLDKSSNHSANSSKSSLTMRRYAKTPILHVGQLEGDDQTEPLGREEKASSVELIAEQYRALIQSRCSILRGSTPSVYEDALEDIQTSPHSSADISVERTLEVPASSSPMMGSPKSDGTLVGFEEDTIYFKPVSFTPEPQSPNVPRLPEFRVPSAIPDNFSLQICLDLLTRELSSALPKSGYSGAAAETQALQVWAMIEAYEKLRDQMLGMNLNVQQRQPLESMFDMWLQALYKIHDKITGNDGQVSESVYED